MGVHRLIYLLFILISNHVLGQNWTPFNDTLTYYYQASNTGDYFTLRTEYKDIVETDTTIYFVNNYIPNDTTNFDSEHIFYNYNGSVLGKTLQIKSDTLLINEDYRLYKDMYIGESKLFSELESESITFSSVADSVIFGIEDSVRYYDISDSTRIILSKSFGLIEYPKQNSDSSVFYNLVGIEDVEGMSFDHHNEIFDFETGDILVYEEDYIYYIGDSEFEHYTHRRKVQINSKFLIDGHYHYDINSYAGEGYYAVYPPIYPESPLFDHPGERAEYCRANDVYSGYAGDPFYDFLIDEQKFVGDHLGHRYTTSPDGNLIHVIGSEMVPDDYHTFGLPSYPYFLVPEGLRYEEWAESFYPARVPDETYAIYEAGFGMRLFYWQGGFSNCLMKSLLGAIKSGDTLGLYDLSINEEQYSNLSFYPNPTSNSIYIETTLSNISVIDTEGKIVFSQQNSSKVNVSDLPSGTYIIKGIDNVGVLRYGKFIKH